MTRKIGDLAGAARGEPAARPRIVVVGAGIAGLAAALRIARDAPAIDLLVCEAGSRPGGVIATERAGDRGEYLVEGGPDSFLTEKPEGLRLCQDLGLGDRLVGVPSAASRAYVVLGGQLVPIPDGFRLVAPTRLLPWLRSPLFSWPGKLRMAMDLVLPRGVPAGDESVASFVVRRFGREAYDRVAQPMIGTIYIGDATALSVAATMPRLLEVERRYRSVIRGMAMVHARAANRIPDRSAPAGTVAERSAALPRFGIFATIADGMQALPDAAATRLPAGVLHLRTAVAAVTKASDASGYTVTLADGRVIPAGGVVLATNAPAAGRLIARFDGSLAAELGAITYASSVAVTLAYGRGQIPRPLDGVGFVVPRVEHRPILAASFASAKFPGRAPDGAALIRAFLGGALAPEMVGLDDDRLVRIVRSEMTALLGEAGTPHLARVHRHHEAMPQYTVGHLDRVAEIERRVGEHPGLALAGAAYRGVGIPDCIRSGETAAQRVLAHVAARRGGRPAPGRPSN